MIAQARDPRYGQRSSDLDCSCAHCRALPAGAPTVPPEYPPRAHLVNRAYQALRARRAPIPTVLRDEWGLLSESIELELPELYAAACEVQP